MRFEREEELEDLLFADWWELREERLAHLHLPSSSLGAHKLVRRQVSMPGASAQAGTGFADLVEVSLRVVPRREILVHIIELKNEPMKVAHLRQVLRYRTSAAVALSQVGGVRVSVFASLLAPDLGELRGVPLERSVVGAYAFDLGLSGLKLRAGRSAGAYRQTREVAAGRALDCPISEMCAHVLDEREATLAAADRCLAVITAAGGDA